MSISFLVIPVVAGGLPIISAAIIAGGAALGYAAVRRLEEDVLSDSAHGLMAGPRSVTMTMPESQVVTDALLRGETFELRKDDIMATFRIDGRGACQVHVEGAYLSEAELTAAGTQLMDKVRQQFAYAKVMAELDQRGFSLVDQHVEENQAIRISVRR
jgi:hypothetical protein